jgi:membrane protein insertase Oxa1/YidC/SpoIIIJ
MKKNLTLSLQGVIVAIGVCVFALLLWEPHLEGVNAHATLFEMYFQDPFLACMYVGSIPFFVALYQAFKVLGYVRQNKLFSHSTVKSLRTIKYCAFITAGAIAAVDAYLLIAARSHNDDPTGAVMLGMVAIVICIVISIGVGTAAARFGRGVQNGQCAENR